MYGECTKLTYKPTGEFIEIKTEGKLKIWVKIQHKFLVYQFKKYFKFKHKYYLK